MTTAVEAVPIEPPLWPFRVVVECTDKRRFDIEFDALDAMHAFLQFKERDIVYDEEIESATITRIRR